MSKNFKETDADEIDNLPSRQAFHRHNLDGDNRDCGCSWCNERHSKKYPPYNRIQRWLFSKIDVLWDNVVSEYVRLPWIPVQFRTYSHLTHSVEVITFVSDNDVAYYELHAYGNALKLVKDQWGEVFYVHPITKKLAFKAKSKNWKKESWREKEIAKYFRIIGNFDQLIKLDGIWYHVWAEDTPENRKAYSFTHPLIYDKELLKFYFTGCDGWFPIPSIKKQLSKKELLRHGIKNDPYIAPFTNLNEKL